MKTISIISKGRDVQFTTKSVTIDGREFLYTHISELRHSEEKRVYGFKCDGEVCMLPYDEKDAQVLKAIFSQIQQMHRTPAPAKAPKATEALAPEIPADTASEIGQASYEQPPVETPQDQPVEFIQAAQPVEPAEVLQSAELLQEEEPVEVIYHEEPGEVTYEVEPEEVFYEEQPAEVTYEEAPEEVFYEEQPAEVVYEGELVDPANDEQAAEAVYEGELVDATNGEQAAEAVVSTPTDKKAERAARKEEKLRLKEQRKAEKEEAKRRKQEEKEAARKAKLSKKSEVSADPEEQPETTAPASTPAPAINASESAIPTDTDSDAEETLSYADIKDTTASGHNPGRFKKSIIIFLIILACLALAAVIWYNFIGPATDPQIGVNSPEDSTQYNDINDMINDLEE